MNATACNPRVLIITPEVTYLPDRMGGLASFYTAKAGGLADVSASLISSLFEQGADVHVAIPDYRSVFSDKLAPVLKKEINRIQDKMPTDRVHLAEDRAFIISTGYILITGEKTSSFPWPFNVKSSTILFPGSSPTSSTATIG